MLCPYIRELLPIMIEDWNILVLPLVGVLSTQNLVHFSLPLSLYICRFVQLCGIISFSALMSIWICVESVNCNSTYLINHVR